MTVRPSVRSDQPTPAQAVTLKIEQAAPADAININDDATNFARIFSFARNMS